MTAWADAVVDGYEARSRKRSRAEASRAAMMRRPAEVRAEFSRKGTQAWRAMRTEEQRLAITKQSPAGVRAWLACMTPEQKRKLAGMAAAGGRASMAKLSPEQKSERGRLAAEKRWGR